MAPVVHDQACALLEHFLAVAELAKEVCLHPVFIRIKHLVALIGVGRHRFETSISLPRRNILAHRYHFCVGHVVYLFDLIGVQRGQILVYTPTALDRAALSH